MPSMSLVGGIRPRLDCWNVRSTCAWELQICQRRCPPFIGTYCAIVSPSKLVFEALGAVGTMDLQDVTGTTSITVTISRRSSRHLLKMGVDAGTARTLDNLVAEIEEMKP